MCNHVCLPLPLSLSVSPHLARPPLKLSPKQQPAPDLHQTKNTCKYN